MGKGGLTFPPSPSKSQAAHRLVYGQYGKRIPTSMHRPYTRKNVIMWRMICARRLRIWEMSLFLVIKERNLLQLRLRIIL